MTKAEKLQFIADLTADVTALIISKIDKMPEEWDGGELRRYIADSFDAQVFEPFDTGSVWGFQRSKRLAAYRNECLTRNL
jgi:hypothetical protein